MSAATKLAMAVRRLGEEAAALDELAAYLEEGAVVGAGTRAACNTCRDRARRLRSFAAGLAAAPETPAEVTAALDAIDRAWEMVGALCKPRGSEGAREWVMSIPARPDHDPDLVIGTALRLARRALAPAAMSPESEFEQRRRLGEAPAHEVAR